MTVADFTKVLVTGGAGFIGSNYVRYAVNSHPEWEIVVLDKLTYAGNLDNLDDLKDRINFIHGDIAEIDDTALAVKGVDAVVNFAAESHVDRSLLDPRMFVRTNTEGTLILLNEARKAGVQRFLHVSTDEVYGDLHGTDTHSLETDCFSPRSPYSASKASAEHFVSSFNISFGMDTVITRGSNTYGQYQYPEKIIPLFITNAFEGKSLPLYGCGLAVRDYMHVMDHVSGIDTMLHKGESGQAYNLGAREERSGVEVAEKILELMNKPDSLISFVTDRPGHDYRYSIDPSKAEALGWERKWSFEDGIAATVKWYLENEPWWRNVKKKLEFCAYEDKWYGGNRSL
ncbi:MAG: dTDP-glucose 4,6-dehydratase [Armatimonadota bacterium]